MNLPRFYCPSITEPITKLGGTEARHIIKVLRLGVAERMELFDGSGTLASASIVKIGTGKVTLQIRQIQVMPKPFLQQIIIAPSIAKGERFDWLIGKCSELGVDRICPVLFDRTVKQAKNPKIIDRWHKLTVAAAKQCRRLHLPRIDAPLPLPQALEILRQDHPKARFLLGSVSADEPALISQGPVQSDVVAFVGPEGGVTEKEQSLLKDSGVKPVHLTDTVLRVETAAVAFAVILTAQRAAGEMKRPSRKGK